MQLSREQGDAKFDLGSTKNIFVSIKKIIQGAGRKGSNFEGSRELGTPSYRVSLDDCQLSMKLTPLVYVTLLLNRESNAQGN